MYLRVLLTLRARVKLSFLSTANISEEGLLLV
jgi:hypothetical protein